MKKYDDIQNYIIEHGDYDAFVGIVCPNGKVVGRGYYMSRSGKENWLKKVGSGKCRWMKPHTDDRILDDIKQNNYVADDIEAIMKENLETNRSVTLFRGDGCWTFHTSEGSSLFMDGKIIV